MKFLFPLTLAVGASALKVAFVGDTGAQTSGQEGYYAKAVFDMIKAEGVNLVMQNGDLDYQDNPTVWSQFLSTHAAGLNVMHTSGNHEDSGSHQSWLENNGYKTQLANNIGVMAQNCQPRSGRTMAQDYGEYMSCTIDNSFFVMVGWQQLEDGATTAEFLRERLASSSKKFKFCVWHRPEGELNPGNKHVSNYRTQALYDICREYGAVVTSGHSHVYGRTKLISSFANTPQISANDSPNPTINCGTTLSFVVGMGGFKFDANGRYAGEPYFQKSYTADDAPGDRAGALFCDTGAAGSTKMDCYFKLAEVGTIVDQFSVTMDTAACTNAVENDTNPGGAIGEQSGAGGAGGSGGAGGIFSEGNDMLIYIGAGVGVAGVAGYLVSKNRQSNQHMGTQSMYGPTSGHLGPAHHHDGFKV